MAPYTYIIYLRWLPLFSEKKYKIDVPHLQSVYCVGISCYNYPFYNPNTGDPIVFNLLQVKCKITFRVICIQYIDDYIYVYWDNTFPESTQVSYKAYHLEHFFISDFGIECHVSTKVVIHYILFPVVCNTIAAVFEGRKLYPGKL